MSTTKRLVVYALFVSLAGCATVRQQDVVAWQGVPVQSLDMHPLFVTMPMYKTLTDNGVEIRNYVNSETAERCFASGGVHRGSGRHASYSEFMSCSENRVVCNNLFYVQDGRVTRYVPTGSCYTDDSVRPQVSVGR